MRKLSLAVAGAVALCAVALGTVPLHAERVREAPRVLAVAQGRGPLLAGGASVPLDAAPGTPIGGYARWDYGSRGVRDAPMARALALSVPGFTAALVSVDVLLVPEPLLDAVRRHLAPLAPDALVVAATHTHAGPGGHWKNALGERFGTGPFDPAAEEALAGRIAQAIRAALDSRGPAALAVARGEASELVVNRGVGERDGRLLVLRLERPSGEVVGQVVTFPSHATVLGKENRLLSGDWPGALARALPGSTVVLQGAEGDQTWHLEHPPAQVRPEDYAHAVAAAVGRVSIPPPVTDVPLAAAVARVRLPGPSFAAVPPWLDRLVSNVAWALVPAEASVTAIRVGPVLLLAVPAEPGEEVGRWWRDGAGPGAEVVSLANGYVGYVETPQLVREGRGEAKRTYYGPELAVVLGDGVAAAAAALPRQ